MTMSIYQIQAQARQRQRALRQEKEEIVLPPGEFIARTMIKVPQSEGFGTEPFTLWPAQENVLGSMLEERLLVLLKARQLGMTWLACGYILWLCTQHKGKFVLVFSRGQLEANEIVDRVRFLFYQHKDVKSFPRLITDNTQELEWANGSRIQSMPATKSAGRSFTASLVVFDEFAFMMHGAHLFAAAKPTVDDGGRLWIISSADGQASPYHQFWQRASTGQNGFKPIFLPWTARPDRGTEWREQRLTESFGDTSLVYREYPENDEEAFSAASGRIFETWSDGPEDGNVTEAADFIPDGGPVLWSMDDGYVGKIDPLTGHYTPESHPRVILFAQKRADGRIAVFQELYMVETLSEIQIEKGLNMGYPRPDYVSMGPGFAELRGRVLSAGLYTKKVQPPVEERIKETRRWISKDKNGVRKVIAHPRCKHLRYEMGVYRKDQDGEIIKQNDHGPDALSYLTWTVRYE